MMKARWITTSASATKASTAPRSRMSPWRYSVRVHACSAGSNGRRAIPMICSTSEACSSASTAEIPMSPVGPVTATVSAIPGGVPRRRDLETRQALSASTACATVREQTEKAPTRRENWNFCVCSRYFASARTARAAL
jgi:hypothetical protein